MTPTRRRRRPSARRRSLTRLQSGGLVVAAACFALPWLVDLPGLSPAGHRMLWVFLVAIVLWITEAIPL